MRRCCTIIYYLDDTLCYAFTARILAGNLDCIIQLPKGSVGLRLTFRLIHLIYSTSSLHSKNLDVS